MAYDNIPNNPNEKNIGYANREARREDERSARNFLIAIAVIVLIAAGVYAANRDRMENEQAVANNEANTMDNSTDRDTARPYNNAEPAAGDTATGTTTGDSTISADPNASDADLHNSSDTSVTTTTDSTVGNSSSSSSGGMDDDSDM